MEDEKSKTKKMKTISFRVDEETYSLFKTMAETFGMTTSDLFRDMLSVGVSIVKGVTHDGII